MTSMTKTLFGSAALCATLLAQPALAQPGHEGHAHAQKGADKTWTEPYALDTCPVSGEQLGSMGDAIVKNYDGREVRFCCSGCIEDFEADKKAYFKQIDAKITADQTRYYPMDTCIIGGDPLIEDGEDIAVEMVYGNRLIRLCCKGCKKDFKADPEKYIEILDKAAAEAQRDNYPLDKCTVSGKALGSMGEPSEMVIAGRLMRFCCAGCEPRAKANPTRYLSKIDKAWQSKGMHMPGGMGKGAHGGMKSKGGKGHGNNDGHGH